MYIGTQSGLVDFCDLTVGFFFPFYILLAYGEFSFVSRRYCWTLNYLPVRNAGERVAVTGSLFAYETVAFPFKTHPSLSPAKHSPF